MSKQLAVFIAAICLLACSKGTPQELPLVWTPTPSPIPTATQTPTPTPTITPMPTTTPIVGVVLSPHMLRIRYCESRNIYSLDTGNGYYGAWQFDQQTWDSWTDSEWKGIKPNLAPKEIQDETAVRLYQSNGGSSWPICQYR